MLFILDQLRAPVKPSVHTERLLLVAPCYFGESNFLVVGTSCAVEQYQRYCKR